MAEDNDDRDIDYGHLNRLDHTTEMDCHDAEEHHRVLLEEMRDPSLRSLRDLAEDSINPEAAKQQMEDSLYALRVVCNFVLHRLHVSCGAKSPLLFQTEARQFLIDNPRFNVKTLDGKGPPITTRGTGGDLIVIDEAAHIPIDLFKETIAPMLELTITSLLAISTPLDEFNFYSKLVEQKDDNGEPFFKTIKAGRICDECSRLPYELMIKCDHIVDGAHWKSAPKLKRLKVLFEDDEARGIRELGGMIASDFTACFQKADIETLYDNPLHSTHSMPSAIYVTVDPNGGGVSKMGVASGFFDGNDLVIIGLEAESVRTHEQQNHLMRKHIARIRQNEHYRNVPIWVIPENNLGLEASHIEAFVRGISGVNVFHEDPEARAGVRKSHTNTNDYQICVENMLRKSQLYFARDMFTTSHSYEKADGSTRTIKAELRQQLERYHWEIAEAKDSFGKRRIAMTGKMGGAQDDLYVALAMLAFWPGVMKKRARTQPLLQSRPLSPQRVQTAELVY